jgi:hypothetical protein
VSGRTTDNHPLRLRLIALCVIFPESVTAPEPAVTVDPVSERDEILPVIASACLVAALILALALVMVARLRTRSRRGPQAQVAVVMRSHHSTFRFDEFREVR